MVNALLRWIVPLAALFALGPVAARLTGTLRALDGGPDATMLVCAQPVQGLIVGVGAVLLAIIAGVFAAVLIGGRMGLFCAGLVLAWGAWATGRVDLIIASAQSGGPLSRIAIEGVIIGALGVLGSAAILLMPSRRAVPGAAGGAAAHAALPTEPRAIREKTGPMGALVAMLVGAVVLWLLAQETLKGQTIAAATFASLLGAAAGRVVAPYANAMWFFIGLCALGVISPLAAMMIHGTGAAGGLDGVTQAALANRLFRPANVLPMDLLAGAFLGVPMGLAWAGSMVERHAHAHTRPA